MSFTVVVKNRVARVTLDAPPLNILTTGVQEGLAREVNSLNKRDDFNLLVLTSALDNFSAGADVREHAGRKKVEAMLKAAHSLIAALLDCPVPTLAAVRGACYGGAFELALACDTLLAAPEASFALPEISLASFPPAALVLAPWKLPSLLASDLIVRGQPMSGSELASRGSGISLAHAGEFLQRLEAIAARYAALSRGAIIEATRLLRPGAAARFLAQVGPIENAYLERILALPDAEEGVKAFVEKRPPNFGHGAIKQP